MTDDSLHSDSVTDSVDTRKGKKVQAKENLLKTSLNLGTSPTRDHYKVRCKSMTMDVHAAGALCNDSPSTKQQSISDLVTTSTQSDAAGGDGRGDLGADNVGKVVLSEAEGVESEKGGPAVVTKTKAKAAVQKKKKKAKQFRAKKPKDMPRRPLSGYNIFFKEERARMLAESSGKRGPGETEGEEETKNDKDVPPAKGVKIGFEVMAKTVGKRWKELPEEELARYKAMAKLDMERYRREMDGYHVDLAKRSRLECEEMSRAQQATAAATVPVANQQHPDMRNQQPQADSAALGSLDDNMRAQFIGSQAANQMHPQFNQMGYPSLQGSFQAQAPSSGQMQGGMQTSSPGMFDSTDGGGNMQQQNHLLEALLGANSMSHSQQSQQYQQPQQSQQNMMGGGNMNSQQMSMQQQYFMQQAAQQQAAQQQVYQQQALQQRQATNDSNQGNSTFYGNNSGNFTPYGANDRDAYGQSQQQTNRGNY
jgi:hypothetical protein